MNQTRGAHLEMLRAPLRRRTRLKRTKYQMGVSSKRSMGLKDLSYITMTIWEVEK